MNSTQILQAVKQMYKKQNANNGLGSNRKLKNNNNDQDEHKQLLDRLQKRLLSLRSDNEQIELYQ